MTMLLAYLGLRSPDPMVPCQCRPLHARMRRHFGRRNYFYATAYRR